MVLLTPKITMRIKSCFGIFNDKAMPLKLKQIRTLSPIVIDNTSDIIITGELESWQSLYDMLWKEVESNDLHINKVNLVKQMLAKSSSGTIDLFERFACE